MPIRTLASLFIALTFAAGVVTHPGLASSGDHGATDFSHKGRVAAGEPPGPDIVYDQPSDPDTPVVIYGSEGQVLLETTLGDYRQRRDEIHRELGIGEYRDSETEDEDEAGE